MPNPRWKCAGLKPAAVHLVGMWVGTLWKEGVKLPIENSIQYYYSKLIFYSI